MTPKEFVRNVHIEKENLLGLYFTSDSDAQVSSQIRALGLSPEKMNELKAIIDGALTDGFYTLLLGLEGSDSIGMEQGAENLFDEDGNELTGGELEAHAYDFFMAE